MKKFIISAIFALTLPVAYGQGETPTAPTAVDNAQKTKITQALTDSSEWFVFQKTKGITRLKLLGEQTYYPPKEGELFKLVRIDDKYYAATQSGKLVEEHWENRNNFSERFIPYKDFVKKIDQEIKNGKEEVDKTNQQIKVKDDKIDNVQKTIRSINISISQLNAINPKSDETRHQLKVLQDQLLRKKREIKDLEKEIKSHKKDIKKLSQTMTKLRDQRKKYPDQPPVGQ